MMEHIQVYTHKTAAIEADIDLYSGEMKSLVWYKMQSVNQQTHFNGPPYLL